MKRRKIEKRTSFVVVFTLALVLGLTFITFAPNRPEAAPKKVLRLMIGTASVTSGHYPASVAVAKIVNRNVPEVSISLVETGGSFECSGRTGGDLDGYVQTGYSAPVARYNGISAFKGKAYKDIRVWYLYSTPVYLFMVRADSGVKTLKDLEGKKYFLGPAGSSAATNSKQLLDALGIKIQQAWGSVPDSVTMTKENRIVGFHKAAGFGIIDATMMDVKTFTSIRVLSYTDEEAKVADGLIPGWVVVTLPVIKGVEEQGPVTAWAEPAGGGLTKNLPPEITYKMIKAMAENWKEVRQSAGPLVVNVDDVVTRTIEYASNVKKGAVPVPLHAGVVKYFKEVGKTVPKSIIPPEYKE